MSREAELNRRFSPKMLFKWGTWYENPVCCHSLGICSALAVTTSVINAVVMGIAVVTVAGFSNLTVSLLRKKIPHRVRMVAEITVIAVFVTVFDQLLKAYWLSMSQTLGPYVGLIITNCLIMGRAESFAIRNAPAPSFMDGVFNGIGYMLVLTAVAVIREPLGMGTVLAVGEWNLFKLPESFPVNRLMMLAPGAFFTIGVIIWIRNAFARRRR